MADTMLVSAVSHEEEQTMSKGDPERERVLDERARRMEEEGGPPVQLPAHDEAEEGGDEVADKDSEEEEC